MFEVIPAIDVSGGRLCRLSIGGPARVDAFGGDPGAATRSFLDAGATWVHIVDVDLALEGEARNLPVIRDAAALGARVQASGGLRTRDDVASMFDAGATRVVLGSAALSDRELVRDLADGLGERLVIGVETEGGRVRPRGRRHDVDLDLGATIAWLAREPIARILHTNVRRVGSPHGPDLRGLATAIASGKPVVAAGGIGSARDLELVRAAGAEGAVIGRAALEGAIDLHAAIAGPRRNDRS